MIASGHASTTSRSSPASLSNTTVQTDYCVLPEAAAVQNETDDTDASLEGGPVQKGTDGLASQQLGSVRGEMSCGLLSG